MYVLWKKLEERVGSVANVRRLGFPGKCWQHPQAGSTFARDRLYEAGHWPQHVAQCTAYVAAVVDIITKSSNRGTAIVQKFTDENPFHTI